MIREGVSVGLRALQALHTLKSSWLRWHFEGFYCSTEVGSLTGVVCWTAVC